MDSAIDRFVPISDVLNAFGVTTNVMLLTHRPRVDVVIFLLQLGLGYSGDAVRRREFLRVVGAASVSWPFVARAQKPTMPVIGFLSGRSAAAAANDVVMFREGLKEVGFVEGRNVAIEFRWADGVYDRLPTLVAEFIRLPVDVIFAGGGPAAPRAAKAATAAIPIVFSTGTDPVLDGLVASLNRPGGNLTGIHILTTELDTKRLELLNEVLPKAATIGVLVNPTFSVADSQVREIEAAARVMGRQVVVLKASNPNGIDTAFVTIAEKRIGALLVASDPFFSIRRAQIVALTTRQAVPAIFQWRDFAVHGGLMSYGTNLAEAYRQVGIYTGRVLKGEKPADLPVHRSTKVELVINLKTAKALNLTFPLSLLGRADEVIE
jgi:putative ABC transport system substrate-binding protein